MKYAYIKYLPLILTNKNKKSMVNYDNAAYNQADSIYNSYFKIIEDESKAFKASLECTNRIIALVHPNLKDYYNEVKHQLETKFKR